MDEELYFFKKKQVFDLLLRPRGYEFKRIFKGLHLYDC